MSEQATTGAVDVADIIAALRPLANLADNFVNFEAAPDYREMTQQGDLINVGDVRRARDVLRRLVAQATAPVQESSTAAVPQGQGRPLPP